MAVENVGEKYRCNVCGNEVSVTKVGAVNSFVAGNLWRKQKAERY